MVGDELYIPSLDTVSVIDVSTNTLLETTISTEGTALDQAVVVGDDIYWADYNGNVIVINTIDKNVIATIPTGNSPTAIVTNDTFVYVTNYVDGTVTVIDVATNTVTDTIVVGSAPSNMVLVGSDVYVLNSSSDTISVISTLTNTVTDTIVGVLDGPYTAALAGDKLYIASYFAGQSLLSIVDTTTKTFIETIDIELDLQSPPAIVLGNKIYFGGNQFIAVLDTLTNTATSIPATNEVANVYQYMIMVGDSLYASSQYAGGRIVEIDTQTDTLVEIFTLGTPVFDMSENNNFLYVVSQNVGVYVVDPETNTKVSICGPTLQSLEIDTDTITLTYDKELDEDSIPDVTDFDATVNDLSVNVTGIVISGQTVVLTIESDVVYGDDVKLSYTVPETGNIRDPWTKPAAAFEEEAVENITKNCGVIPLTGTNPFSGAIVGNYLYTNDTGSETISVVNLVTSEVDETIDVGTAIYQSTLVGDKLYLSSYEDGEILIFDTSDNTLTGETIEVSSAFYSTLVGTDLYVTQLDNASVAVIDTLTNTVTDTINVGNSPYHLVLGGTELFVSNSGAISISVIDTLTNTVTDTIFTGSQPYSATIVGDKLYVNDYGAEAFYVIDIPTKTNDVDYYVGGNPLYSILINGKLYTTLEGQTGIFIIDPADGSTLDIISTDDAPFYLAYKTNTLYAISLDASTVTVIDTETDTLYVCEPIFSVTYAAGEGGSINGDVDQIVGINQDATPVTAVPDEGYEFVDWSDNSTANPRTDTAIVTTISVTANFSLIGAEEEVEEENTNFRQPTRTGTTLAARFANLVNMGKT
ncbi:MAG: SwmB domain-containing protein [Candidatus Paceibacterota bacterium]